MKLYGPGCLLHSRGVKHTIIGYISKRFVIFILIKTTSAMEFLTTLWLPILLSAVFVFILSSVIHMFLGYHASDYKKLSNEDQFMDALRPMNIPPGHYAVPKPGTRKEFSSPEFQAKMNKGPAVIMSVRAPGMNMGPTMIKWFAFLLLVNVFVAYVTSHTISPGADYLTVHRVAGCVAFMGYGLALFQDAIWYGKSWSAT